MQHCTVAFGDVTQRVDKMGAVECVVYFAGLNGAL